MFAVLSLKVSGDPLEHSKPSLITPAIKDAFPQNNSKECFVSREPSVSQKVLSGEKNIFQIKKG